MAKFLRYNVVYEEAPEGGYVAYVPFLPGCHSQGETIEEAQKNIKEAAELYLEVLKEERSEIERPTRSFQGMVEVALR